MSLAEFSDIRRMILELLKKERVATIMEISQRLDVTYEAVRQQIVQLEREGWIQGRIRRAGRKSAGRPISQYSLTVAGDHLFLKNYDLLAIRLVETVGEELGTDALVKVLVAVTDAQVGRWEKELEGKSIEERLELLKDLYEADDPFMDIDRSDGELRLVEKNCPFLNVAMRHPALCSTSVSTLTRLLGVRVIREERFQSGDRRCVFRVLRHEPADPGFTFALELPVYEGPGQG